MRAATAPADNLQFRLEVVTLRRLRLGLEHAQEAIARSLLAYQESRELLGRMQGSGIRDQGSGIRPDA